MLESFTKDLVSRLDDPEYAKTYGAELAKLDFAMTLMRVRARMEGGLTQKLLSDRLGVSQPYVARLESGEANPTLSSIGKMLAVLGLRLRTDVEPLKPQAEAASVLPPQQYWNTNSIWNTLWTYQITNTTEQLQDPNIGGNWVAAGPNYWINLAAPAAEPTKEYASVGGQA